MKFKNMKIEINEQQTKSDVISQLTKLGYSKSTLFFDNHKNPTVICACADGDIMDLINSGINASHLVEYEKVNLIDLENMESSQ